MIQLTIIVMLLSLTTTVGAQILWEHKTSDVWLNPQTQEVDSSICFTAISCKDNDCTAAAILFNYPINPIGRITFYRSTDDGHSWHEQPPTVPFNQLLCNWGISKMQQIDSLHAVGIADLGAVYRTSDGGASWHRRDLPVEKEILDVHFSDPNVGVAVTTGYENTIYTTSDGGEHWVNREYYSNNTFSCYSHGNGKFSFSRYGKGPIYRTIDNFATIDTLPFLRDTNQTIPNNRYIFSKVHFNGTDTIFATGSFRKDSNTASWDSDALIMRSTNNGQSWEEPWTFPVTTLARVKHLTNTTRDTIFAGGGDFSNILLSTDRGATWRSDSLYMDTLTYDPWNKCFGISISSDGYPIGLFGPGPLPIVSHIWRGVYQTNSIEVAQTIRYHTKMYPNPSSGTVNITTSLNTKDIITVIDMLGREVYKSRLDEQGNTKLNLSEFPRGIYHVVIHHYGREFSIGKVALTLE